MKILITALLLLPILSYAQTIEDIEVLRNVEWKRSSMSRSTFVAKYNWEVKNVNLRRQIKCTFHIKGVTVDRSTGEITRVADIDTYNFELQGQESKTLKGRLKIKLWNTYTHTGVRESQFCHYKD